MNLYDKIKVEALKYLIWNMNISYKDKYELLSAIDYFSRINDFINYLNNIYVFTNLYF